MSFEAEAGDVFIWHAQLYHGGSAIEDQARTRRSLVTHYFRAQDMDPGAVVDAGGGRYYLQRAINPSTEPTVSLPRSVTCAPHGVPWMATFLAGRAAEERAFSTYGSNNRALELPRTHREPRATRAEGALQAQRARLGLVAHQPGDDPARVRHRVRHAAAGEAAGRRQRLAPELRAVSLLRPRHLELLHRGRERFDGRPRRRRWRCCGRCTSRPSAR